MPELLARRRDGFRFRGNLRAVGTLVSERFLGLSISTECESALADRRICIGTRSWSGLFSHAHIRAMARSNPTTHSRMPLTVQRPRCLIPVEVLCAPVGGCNLWPIG